MSCDEILDNIDFFEGYKKNGQPRLVSRNGETYWAQTYLDEHENEYTRITNEEIIHYRNGVVERIWKLKNGTIIDSVTVYNDGFAMYNQSWESLSELYSIRNINNLSKDVKELVDSHTQNVIYRGSLDDNGNRIGRGFEFDAATGKLKLEGVWECNELKSITRIFEDDNKMIEFKSTTSNLELHEQIPIYVGGYKYNELHNTCSRDGKGFLINEDGVATMEGEWKNGIETERTVMKNGWYHVDEDPLNMPIDSEVIRVPAYKLKYINFLDLSKYKKMKTLDIGEYNFCNTESFTISSNENLETVKIGDFSFYRFNKVDRMNRTFRIVDCTKLRSIYIGSCSFYYYSGGFELRGLPNLEILEVGKVGVDSGSFSYCNFVAKDLPKLNKIVIGDHAFETEEIIELSDLPSLETLELGWVVFSGKLNIGSLTMKNLPKLRKLTSRGFSFRNIHTMRLINIPNLEILKLHYLDEYPDSDRPFPEVMEKYVENVAPILADLVVIAEESPFKPGIYFDDLKFDYTESVINIPPNSCNDVDRFIDINKFTHLEKLIVGKDSFKGALEFHIDQLNELTEIHIFNRAFDTGCTNQIFGPFAISNCSQLESIILEPFSFTHYVKSFSLENLPSLKHLQIGRIGSYSASFRVLSFCIKDLPKLESVIMGNEAFQYAMTTRFENLESLKTIEIGDRVFMGSDDQWCQVDLINLPKLEKLEAGLECFKETRIYFLINIPIVIAELDHESAFKKAVYCTQSKISSSLRKYLE